jgi:hypothetical protein
MTLVLLDPPTGNTVGIPALVTSIEPAAPDPRADLDPSPALEIQGCVTEEETSKECLSEKSLQVVEVRTPKGVELTKAQRYQCRWIFGPADAGAVCCGAPTNGGSWCDVHHQRVYNRPKRQTTATR